jgi:hypothetical protein
MNNFPGEPSRVSGRLSIRTLNRPLTGLGSPEFDYSRPAERAGSCPFSHGPASRW